MLVVLRIGVKRNSRSTNQYVESDHGNKYYGVKRMTKPAKRQTSESLGIIRYTDGRGLNRNYSRSTIFRGCSTLNNFCPC